MNLFTHLVIADDHKGIRAAARRGMRDRTARNVGLVLGRLAQWGLTLLGLLIIGCGPALIAGASRPIRRPRDRTTGWERLSDVVLIPLIGAFAVQGMVRALPGLSGYAMPIAESANTIALVVLAGLLARVALEELVARAYPARLAAATPRNVPSPGMGQRIAASVITGDGADPVAGGLATPAPGSPGASSLNASPP